MDKSRNETVWIWLRKTIKTKVGSARHVQSTGSEQPVAMPNYKGNCGIGFVVIRRVRGIYSKLDWRYGCCSGCRELMEVNVGENLPYTLNSHSTT